MYIRTKRLHQNGKVYEYLLIVETVRTAKGPRQRTVANLGRKDRLEPDSLDKLVRSMAPLAQGTVIFDPKKAGEGYRGSRGFGPLPVFDRLFEELGIGSFLRGAETAMPLDKAVLAMVASRLMAPASKLRTFEEWLPEVYFPAFEGLKLHHFYRALDLLADRKDALEKRLWDNTRSLFEPAVDLVLVDTTNTYVEGDTRGDLAQFGKSKEKRYDRRLLSVGVLVTKDGVPIGHEVFPGNLHDTRAFTALIASLRGRFLLDRVMLCADRGMVSEKILDGLREAGIPYVVGSRLTRTAEAAISDRGGLWQDLKDFPDLRIKPYRAEDGEAYVVCLNKAEAAHEKARRKEIVIRLRALLRKNPSGSGLLRNTSFRPYVRLEGKLVSLDREALRRRERYDGKYVLRSHSELTPEETYRAYRQLSRVEQVFRTVKGPLRLRPVRHFVDRRIRGHIMVCFLAYALEMALRQAMGRKRGLLPGDILDEHGFAETMQALRRVTVADVTTSTGTYQIRSPLEGRAFDAYRAVGLQPPPQLLSGALTTASDPSM